MCDLPPTTSCLLPCVFKCPGGGSSSPTQASWGAVLVPSKGYWASSFNSTFMNACPGAGACSSDADGSQAALVACQQAWYSTPPDERGSLPCQVHCLLNPEP